VSRFGGCERGVILEYYIFVVLLIGQCSLKPHHSTALRIAIPCYTSYSFSQKNSFSEGEK
jgi:hypothetical protein